MDPLLDLRGIITALNTPFTDDDRVCLDDLARNAAMALDAGVVGLLVPAMASEVGKLTEDEREQMVRTVLDASKGRAVVIGGASADTPERRLQAARRLIELGCDGILVSIPFQDEAQYTRDVHDVAALAPPLLMIQDWDASGFGVPVPVIARLFKEEPAFRCLKVEVAAAGAKYSAVIEATGGRLHVSGGWAVTQMIEALDRGVHAFMPTGLHNVYTRIYSLHRRGRRDEARALFNRLLPVLAFSNQHLDISIHFFKRLLHRQEVYSTARVRKPIIAFDDFHERVAGELIDYAIGLMAEID